MKSLLVVFQCSPHSTGSGQEGLDAVLAAVAMDIDVRVAFVDDGIFLITRKTHSNSSVLRNYTKGFAALAELGVDGSYVDDASMKSRGLTAGELAIKTKVLAQNELCRLVTKHDLVLTF